MRRSRKRLDSLTLVVIGKDAAACASFDRSYVECDLRLIANVNNEAISVIANRELATSKRVFGLVHADTSFGAGALDAFVRSALNDNVCGIVGRVAGDSYLNRWCSDNPGPVATLDGCSVFFRVDSGLVFDAQTFDSYHCHVEDLCMQAQAKGIPVVVPRADAAHGGKPPNAEWLEGYQQYKRKLLEKWHDRQVWTT